MKQSNKQYAIALYQATRDVSESDLEQIVKNFLFFLAKEHRLKQVNGIIAEFIKYAKKQEGMVDIEITTARSLDKKTIEEIKKIFGRQTACQEHTDKSLLGGVIIKTEEAVFDASLKTQLLKLKQTFH